ncbi:hypothetical protein KC909_02615 [Candidatus Dojkabacteria bacterium]|uniref:Heat-inducible transcription repressor HrcA C-terminal domain-containing protein n=1 Tax=Candidatus Dojkabacteria bacterium TaxID=2099670 RepID=A0A955RJC4_9BACT|nr:hypothetical protein [Candidatus Dojkabacteria bacterium]
MTPRQQRLLQAIIDEFIDTAEAVGSVNLARKYRLGVSPATIRNEMAALVDEGYLSKPHTSSGRVPTSRAFRFAIESLIDSMEEPSVHVTSPIYEEFHQHRFDRDQLIMSAAQTLADVSGNVGLVMLRNRLYYAGLSNLTKQPEFSDLETLKSVLQLLEDSQTLLEVFDSYEGDKDLRIMVGKDIGLPTLDNLAIIFSLIKLHDSRKGHIAIVGANRMNYSEVLPMFTFVTKSLNKVVSGW